MEAKPPIGVIPRSIWLHKRALELARSIHEYVDFGNIQPVDQWIIELSGILIEMKNEQN